MSDDPAFGATLQELWRLVVERKIPNGVAIESFGAYRELIEALRLAYESEVNAAASFEAAGRTYTGDPIKEMAREWELWSRQPDYQPLALALQEAAANAEQPTTTDLRWLKAQIELIPPGKDGAELRTLLEPTLKKVIGLDDDVIAVACLEEMRRYFKWKTDTFRAYREIVVKARQRLKKETRPELADVQVETDELGETVPPPVFLSPALAEYGGIVYVSHKMAFKVTRRSRRGAITTTVWKPVIIASDRRRIIPTRPPEGADPDSVWWLDETQRLALIGGFSDAPDRRWSYDSLAGFLNGATETVKAHEVYDNLMASLKRYVYHADDYSYVVDVLWTMGTYFYRLWNAYPYLALHGERGTGKSTLLNWLSAVCFNAEFVVNTSEASLYRSIQAKAPTLLIDEQEGLNSSKAARETKADLMGILKSGYKAGARVARQNMERKDITEYFEVYSPKALAAIELFEDVLENRAILTFMTTKPAGVQTEDDGAIIRRDETEFAPLRDSLYLLLMQEAQNIRKITERVKFEAHNRFRELFLPLYVMAALVDWSRGAGRQTIDLLVTASEAKADVRKERDLLTPEATLRAALVMLCRAANDDQIDFEHGTNRADGTVLVDTIQIKQAFEGLFSSRDQSFFNDTWLGKQVMKVDGISPATPRRRHRKILDRDPVTFEQVAIDKFVTCYVLDPAILEQGYRM